MARTEPVAFCIALHLARLILHVYSYGGCLVCVGKSCIQSTPTHPASTKFAVPASQLVSFISRYSLSKWLRSPFSCVWLVVVALLLRALNAEMPFFSILALLTHKAYCKCETLTPQSHCKLIATAGTVAIRTWRLAHTTFSRDACTCHSLSEPTVWLQQQYTHAQCYPPLPPPARSATSATTQTNVSAKQPT